MLKQSKVPGVERTVVIPGFKPPHVFQAMGGVAVIADNTWSAMQGREALKVEWDAGWNATLQIERLQARTDETARKPQKVARNVGDVDAEFAKGGKTQKPITTCPLLSHAPMEPPAAVAEFKDGKRNVLAATQNPQAVQETVAGAIGH